MNVVKRFLKIYHDKDGWTKVKTPEVEHLNSRIYFDYKELSDLYDYASHKNFKSELDEASNGLSTVIMYRNMYQIEINEKGEEDTVLIAKMFIVCRFSASNLVRYSREVIVHRHPASVSVVTGIQLLPS